MEGRQVCSRDWTYDLCACYIPNNLLAHCTLCVLHFYSGGWCICMHIYGCTHVGTRGLCWVSSPNCTLSYILNQELTNSNCSRDALSLPSQPQDSSKAHLALYVEWWSKFQSLSLQGQYLTHRAIFPALQLFCCTLLLIEVRSGSLSHLTWVLWKQLSNH